MPEGHTLHWIADKHRQWFSDQTLVGTNRPFTLPILVALYRDKKTCEAEGRRHKTAAEILCGLLAVLMRWFPERKLVFAGDNAYGGTKAARGL